jgi:hypothetical protein
MRKCRHRLTVVACLLTLFTPIENRVKCVFCFCLCRVTLLLNNNSIDKYRVTLEIPEKTQRLEHYVPIVSKLELVNKLATQHSYKYVNVSPLFTCRQTDIPITGKIFCNFSLWNMRQNQNGVRLYTAWKMYLAATYYIRLKNTLFSLLKYNNCTST